MVVALDAGSVSFSRMSATTRQVGHGRSIEQLSAQTLAPAKTLVVQMDGSMIPVVERGRGADARKGKQLLWREARLCLARASDRTQGLYGASLGSAQSAGWMWREVALKAGLDRHSQVHGLGDGAPWIVDQFRENFGAQGDDLLDFYHVSEYLAQAALKVAGANKTEGLDSTSTPGMCSASKRGNLHAPQTAPQVHFMS